ncbi:MAG: NADH:flavin oxidoreductase, partial [Proteobacteria bacterium]|nr:NADH:flavin oxidoreductase [Pseudomonadota bacterium]
MELIRLFEPVTINGMVLKNRIVLPSMGLAYTDRQEFNPRLAAFYMERVRGGAGLITVGPCGIDKAGSVPFMVDLAHDGNLPALGDFLGEVHESSDAKVAVQLLHMGRYALSWLSGEPCLAPSAIPSRLTGETPREMTKEDMRRVRGEYVSASRRAVSAGFDVVEILACTG